MPHAFLTEVDLIDIFTLVKVENSAKIRSLKEQVKNIEVGCCGNNKDIIDFSYPGKQKDNMPYRCIEFVLSIHQSNSHELTK